MIRNSQDSHKRAFSPDRKDEPPQKKQGVDKVEGEGTVHANAAAAQHFLGTLRDLPWEMHAQIFGDLVPADRREYNDAITPYFPQAAPLEVVSAALCADIRTARTTLGLLPHLGRLADVHATLVEEPIREYLAALRRMVVPPLQPGAVVRDNHVHTVLEYCRRQAARLHAPNAQRIEQQCRYVELTLGTLRTADPQVLSQSLDALPQLMPHDRSLAATGVLDRIRRRARTHTNDVTARSAAFQEAANRCLDASATMSPAGRARVCHAAYRLDDQWASFTGAEMDGLGDRLMAIVADLPPAAAHAAVPHEESQFVDVMAAALEKLPDDASRLDRFDALLDHLPAEPIEQRVAALDGMTGLLNALAPREVFFRLERIVQEVSALPARHMEALGVFEAVVSETVFDALHPTDRSRAARMLTDALRAAPLSAPARNAFLAELRYRIAAFPDSAEKTALLRALVPLPAGAVAVP